MHRIIENLLLLLSAYERLFTVDKLFDTIK